MIVIGLTGSIGMGKSTTAGMFADAGARVWDADQAVHRLYGAGGKGVAAINVIAPWAVVDGAVSRDRLRELVLSDAGLLKQVESAIHPLVAEDRAAFLDQAREDGAKFAVLDIPLLFETGGAAKMDAVVVASAPAEIQRQRVLERPNMTEQDFEAILAKQTPDAEKRAKADFVVETGEGIEAASAQVAEILETLGKGKDPTNA